MVRSHMAVFHIVQKYLVLLFLFSWCSVWPWEQFWPVKCESWHVWRRQESVLNSAALAILSNQIQHVLNTSLAKWLRLCASNAGGIGSMPGQGTEILHATWPKRKKKKKLSNPACTKLICHQQIESILRIMTILLIIKLNSTHIWDLGEKKTQ